MVRADLGAVTAVATEIQPWELHSELVLVCPEVCRRALELLPERDPDAFLNRPRTRIVAAAGTDESVPGVPAAVGGYALLRLGQAAKSALVVGGGLVVLASLAEFVH
jgi:hypothetical protein